MLDDIVATIGNSGPCGLDLGIDNSVRPLLSPICEGQKLRDAVLVGHTNLRAPMSRYTHACAVRYPAGRTSDNPEVGPLRQVQMWRNKMVRRHRSRLRGKNGLYAVLSRQRFFRAGVMIGSFPCPKPRNEVTIAAKAGLRRFDADAARILDDKGQELEVVRVDA